MYVERDERTPMVYLEDLPEYLKTKIGQKDKKTVGT